MLEALLARDIDIYITIIGAVVGFLLSYFFSSNNADVGSITNINQSVTINNIKRRARTTVTASQKKDENIIFLYITIFLIVYFFFRSTILSALLYSGLLLFSMWFGATLRMYIFGSFNGSSWTIYLLFVFFFILAYFVVVSMAFKPIYAPNNFQFIESIINRDGLIGVKQYFDIKDLPWAISHLMGIMFLFLAFWNMSLSLLHMLLSGVNLVTGGAANKQSWLVKKTARYFDRPWQSMFVLVLLILLAGTLVSGYAYEWLKYEFPKYMDIVINTVLHGRS